MCLPDESVVAISVTDAAFGRQRRHSKQGSVKPLTIIDGSADWSSTSLEGREAEYTYVFTEADTAELLAAVDKLRPRVATEEDVKQVCCLTTIPLRLTGRPGQPATLDDCTPKQLRKAALVA